MAYRYRKFKVDDKLTVLCRCQLDAVTAGKKTEENPEGKMFMKLHALNEFDPATSGPSKPRLRTGITTCCCLSRRDRGALLSYQDYHMSCLSR